MNFFEKYFIPHAGNKHHPHFFRVSSLSILLFLILFLFVATVSSRLILSKSDYLAAVLSGVLVELANENREVENIHSLTRNPLLDEAAKRKAEDMAAKSYFAHRSPDGKSPWYWFNEVGYEFSYAGENLAVHFNESLDVNRAWLNSPLHRANLLNDHFTEIGIGTAEGIFEGRSTIFVVQLFGRPVATEDVVGGGQITTVISPPNGEGGPSPDVAASVLGESEVNEMFATTENAPALLEESPLQPSPRSSISAFLFSPGKVLATFYLLLTLLIVCSLLILFLVEVRRHHVLHVVFAFILLVLMGVLFYLYRMVLFSPLLIA